MNLNFLTRRNRDGLIHICMAYLALREGIIIIPRFPNIFPRNPEFKHGVSRFTAIKCHNPSLTFRDFNTPKAELNSILGFMPLINRKSNYCPLIQILLVQLIWLKLVRPKDRDLWQSQIR
ncbi:hypothetical protein D3C71_1734000 [compost metagenome]